MANIIALIWDFDKTLIDGYMQDPIFDFYKIESTKFWQEINSLPKRYYEEQGIQVNPDTIYLNRNYSLHPNLGQKILASGLANHEFLC